MACCLERVVLVCVLVACAQLAAGDSISLIDVDTFIKQQMVASGMPALAAAVTQGENVVWSNAYGYGDPVTRQNSLETTSGMMLASVSKTFLAVTIMQFRERGLLELDDDIDQYLPFSVRNPSFPESAITMRMLMTHTSSISDIAYFRHIDQFYVTGDSPTPLGAFLEEYLLPGGRYYGERTSYLAVPPGSVFQYSNVASALAGFVIETIAGSSFSTVSHVSLLAPLGLRNSGWLLSEIDNSNDTLAYPSSFDFSSRQFSQKCHYGYPDYPNGELRASVASVAVFLATIASNGTYFDRTILNAESVEEMTAVQEGLADEDQGLFWYYEPHPHRRLLGHNGGDVGVATTMFLDVHSRYGVVLLTNGDWAQHNYVEAMSGIQDFLFDTFDPVPGEAPKAPSLWAQRVADADPRRAAPSATHVPCEDL